MTDFILIHGDGVIFSQIFGNAVFMSVPKTNLTASGKETINGKKIAVAGDEKKVSVMCDYSTPIYTVPGKGVLKITNLGEDQKARKKTDTNGASALLKGTKFIAEFKVLVPAKQPLSPPVPDPMLTYTGQGEFQNNNTKVKGT